MRPVLSAVVAPFALPLAAANIRFDPPNPNSLTPVTAHIYVMNFGVRGTLAWAHVSITNNETQHVMVIAPE